MAVRVRTGARLHLGFRNLSLARERLYGGLGVALDAPGMVVTAERASAVTCDHPDAAVFARTACEELDVAGVRVQVERALPRHVGLGSGTQLACAVLAAIGRAYGRDPDVRALAPALGRGGRSGVGVATFEGGGFVLDAGHPTARFTTDRPPRGAWSVPAVAVRRPVPTAWRFVLVRPDVAPGRSDDEEDAGMRSVVKSAGAEIADEVDRVVVERLLPALAEDDVAAFGRAAETIGRLNGAWYAGEQGGVFRPPVDGIVDVLGDASAVYGTGQSSWGPTVYAVTDADHADEAVAAGEAALDAVDETGTVQVVTPRNRGATIEPMDGGHETG